MPSCPGRYERRGVVHHEPAPQGPEGETVFIGWRTARAWLAREMQRMEEV